MQGHVLLGHRVPARRLWTVNNHFLSLLTYAVADLSTGILLYSFYFGIFFFWDYCSMFCVLESQASWGMRLCSSVLCSACLWGTCDAGDFLSHRTFWITYADPGGLELCDRNWRAYRKSVSWTQGLLMWPKYQSACGGRRLLLLHTSAFPQISRLFYWQSEPGFVSDGVCSSQHISCNLKDGIISLFPA